MFVAYVWPFRELPESLERKTFFWLECNYGEAIELLGQVSLSASAMSQYNEHLSRFRTEGHEQRNFGDGLEVYSRIGFLISEDGKNVDWAPPGFPISNMWNASNPFEVISPLDLETFKDFAQMADRFAQQNPEFSSDLMLPAESGRVCPARPSRDAQLANDEWAIEPGDGRAN